MKAHSKADTLTIIKNDQQRSQQVTHTLYIPDLQMLPDVTADGDSLRVITQPQIVYVTWQKLLHLTSNLVQKSLLLLLENQREYGLIKRV